ncbi:Otoferlin [Lonchura striata]|uniref:Otoferlin n=1 Tax=Lonchura striata TaxID=40157 RepID=A0A218UJ90_9PASE|nr:Otoferlin [Lonchura striata domestica]
MASGRSISAFEVGSSTLHLLSYSQGFTQKTRKVCRGPEAIFKEMRKLGSCGAYGTGMELISVLVIKLDWSQCQCAAWGKAVKVVGSRRYSHCFGCVIYIELDLCYQLPNSSSGTWVEEDFVYLMKDSSELIIHNPGFEQLEITEWLRVKELDKKAAALGRKLAKGLETDEEEEEEEDFYYTSETGASGTIFSPVKSCSRLCSARDLFAIPTPQSFQVGINVIEAQKLVGVNINPFVVVKCTKCLGPSLQGTPGSLGLSCLAFLFQYFLFDFYEPRDILFHRLIEISVYMSSSSSFTGYWYSLMILCVDTVCNGQSKGERQNMNLSFRNLLLPKRFPSERPWARVCIKLYSAEGLSSMRAGIMGGISKIIGERKVFIDPYVQVSFCGQQMFPPMSRKIKVQVLDDASVRDVAIATHYIDLQEISDPDRKGFNPMFGQAWVNLYGSPQNSALWDVHKDFNEGMGEGIFYRGHILMAITVEIFSSPSAAERKLGYRMRDALGKMKLKKKSEKSKEKTKELSQLQGEGEAGSFQEAKQPREVTVEVGELHLLPELSSPVLTWLIHAKSYSYLPMTHEKPCMQYSLSAERETMAHPNNLDRCRTKYLMHNIDFRPLGLAPALTDGRGSDLQDGHVATMAQAWSRYLGLTHLVDFVGCLLPYVFGENWRPRYRNGLGDDLALGEEDWRILYSKQGLRVRQHLTQDNVKEKVKETRRILAKIRFMAKEPRCTLPDVLIWMLSNNRRVAYDRIPAQNILYSVVEEEKGKDCAKIQTVFMKVPGLHTGEIFAKLEIYMWLGVTKYAKNCLAELPEEFLSESEQEIAQLSAYSPPSQLNRDGLFWGLPLSFFSQTSAISSSEPICIRLEGSFLQMIMAFQIHLQEWCFQLIARPLGQCFGSPSGTFVCPSSQMLEETLSPMWNDLLLSDQVIIDGKKKELKTETPIIIINLFSHNKFGSPDFLGQAFAVPQVKLVDEPYTKPALQFFDFYRGSKAAGELIATFELIELDYSGYLEPSVPEDVEPKEPSYLEDPHAGRFIISTEGVLHRGAALAFPSSCPWVEGRA